MKIITVILFAIISIGVQAQSKSYSCLPCGQECDKAILTTPGNCAHCGMALVEKSAITFKSISFDALCARLKANPKIVLLDVRSPGEFNGTTTEVPSFGHFNNAININVAELESHLKELSKYKNQEVIVYCSHSHRSPRASYMLTTNGFTNVTNVEGGVSTLTLGTIGCLGKAYTKHAH